MCQERSKVDKNIRQVLHTITYLNHQKNRSVQADYIETFSPKPSRLKIWFHTMRKRLVKAKRRPVYYYDEEVAVENHL